MQTAVKQWTLVADYILGNSDKIHYIFQRDPQYNLNYRTQDGITLFTRSSILTVDFTTVSLPSNIY
jgi:hypothetical protein